MPMFIGLSALTTTVVVLLLPHSSVNVMVTVVAVVMTEPAAGLWVMVILGLLV